MNLAKGALCFSVWRRAGENNILEAQAGFGELCERDCGECPPRTQPRVVAGIWAWRTEKRIRL